VGYRTGPHERAEHFRRGHVTPPLVHHPHQERHGPRVAGGGDRECRTLTDLVVEVVECATQSRIGPGAAYLGDARHRAAAHLRIAGLQATLEYGDRRSRSLRYPPPQSP